MSLLGVVRDGQTSRRKDGKVGRSAIKELDNILVFIDQGSKLGSVFRLGDKLVNG